MRAFLSIGIVIRLVFGRGVKEERRRTTRNALVTGEADGAVHMVPRHDLEPFFFYTKQF